VKVNTAALAQDWIFNFQPRSALAEVTNRIHSGKVIPMMSEPSPESPKGMSAPLPVAPAVVGPTNIGTPSIVPDPATPSSLSPEEQMALFEKELKENDWGHQPC
jgi:hypothetical protein